MRRWLWSVEDLARLDTLRRFEVSSEAFVCAGQIAPRGLI